jgi:hypothetical protein
MIGKVNRATVKLLSKAFVHSTGVRDMVLNLVSG